MTTVGNVTFGPRHWDSIARRYVEHDTTVQETFGALKGMLLRGEITPNKAREMQAELDAVEVGAVPAANDNGKPTLDASKFVLTDINWLTGVLTYTEVPVAAQPARRGDFMQTFSGRPFWPLDARADEVHIEDIAHALSLQCRYAGHCLKFYSVAEHSVMLAQWLTEMGETVESALTGLLHDATEAYLVDMPRPVKRSMHEYRLHEAALWRVIATHYWLPEDMPSVVHEADTRIIADELVNMRPMAWHAKHDDPLHVDLKFWSPAEAEAQFLAAYHALENMRAA